MKKICFSFLLFSLPVLIFAQNKPASEYTLVTYNIENLFDADGKAVFDDYKPTGRHGKPLYTKEDVLTKIQHAVQVLKQYNAGKGPDIVVMQELESDFSPGNEMDSHEFLAKYNGTTLNEMLGEGFNDQIADLPSHLLLLKGMADAGMWHYNVEVGKNRLDGSGSPENAHNNATFSRFPVIGDKTKVHYLHRARPVLETWIEINDYELLIFNNHWKSGASSEKMEAIRIQNARVLRNRLDEVLGKNPKQDMIIAGDFNSDYNQSYRYNFDTTAVNDVLGSIGDEEKVAGEPGEYIFNLWYDYPIEYRGSDTYRGKWGTLMQIMISSGMYDEKGIQYVDNSIEVGDFGFNTYENSGIPKRWHSSFTGSGYSDHLPISMKFRIADENYEYSGFSVQDDEIWKPIGVSYALPSNFITEQEFTEEDPRTVPEFFDQYVYTSAKVTKDLDFVVNGITFDVYAPSFDLKDVLLAVAGTNTQIYFYGRFSQYRGNWQFVVEEPGFIEIVNN